MKPWARVVSPVEARRLAGVGTVSYVLGTEEALRPKESIEGACNAVGPGGIRCFRVTRRSHKIHHGAWGP